MLIGREEELRVLEKLSVKDGFKILILSGARRSGRTELVSNFIKRKSSFYFSAKYGYGDYALERFKAKALQVLNLPAFRPERSDSWLDILRSFFQRMAPKFFVIVFDDFDFLWKNDKSFVSIFKKSLLSSLKRNVFLILCVLDKVAPAIHKQFNLLFEQEKEVSIDLLRLSPVKFNTLRSFFPDYSFKERVQVYSFLGGRPCYLKRFDPKKTIEQNVKQEILSSDSFLYREPLYYFEQDFREMSIYLRILSAVAAGYDRLGSILSVLSDRSPQLINKYMYVLRSEGYIERLYPLSENDPIKSHKGRYRILDFYIRFWLRYVFPNMSHTESGDVGYVWENRIRPGINDFVEPIYKHICHQEIVRNNRYNKLPFKAEKIGPWWNQKFSSDIIAHDGKGKYLFCDCRWREEKTGISALNDLQRIAGTFADARNKHWGFFAKAGFSEELIRISRENKNVHLYSVI